MNRVSREDLERFLAGHRHAEVRLRQETLRRLRALSIDEAREEYDSLCRVREAFRGSGNERALDYRAIEDRVELRRRLDARR